MLNSLSSAPVVSIALGDGAMFLVAGLSRKDPVQRLMLQSREIDTTDAEDSEFNI